jgi:hypothetical protein
MRVGRCHIRLFGVRDGSRHFRDAAADSHNELAMWLIEPDVNRSRPISLITRVDGRVVMRRRWWLE